MTYALSTNPETDGHSGKNGGIKRHRVDVGYRTTRYVASEADTVLSMIDGEARRQT